MQNWLIALATNAIENGWTPDWATRWGIRNLCSQRKRSLPLSHGKAIANGLQSKPATGQVQTLDQWTADFLKMISQGEIAVATADANQQHYELPPSFFTAFLGPRRKYSACNWSEGAKSISEAEDCSLTEVCSRAEICDGMSVLDMGCGWGSFSLWVLEKFPNCRVTSVSNSAPQREYILDQAKQRGWSDRLNVVTADMNAFDWAPKQFDRVVSIEMFEHMRNHGRLLGNVRRWLKDDGKLFIHVFCHKQFPYLFQTDGAANWMGRYFFTGGMMPSFDLLENFSESFIVGKQWKVNGVAYGKTLDAWLELLDQNRRVIDPILSDVYGAKNLVKWRNRWRIFLMASSELFRYDHGNEWFVGHYLLEPAATN